MIKEGKWGSKKWQTWINHAVIAAVIAFVLSFVLSPAEAARMAVWGYLFREVNQQRKRLMRGAEMFWVDSIMDVAVTVPAVALVWWLLIQ